MIEIGQEFFFGKDTLGWFIEKSFSFYEMCLDVNDNFSTKVFDVFNSG